ncbi:MAG: hypothetical protein KA248_15865 [Kiritimatiellae bacterium]|nr:hypothetical protein [Kiritimatiellia bacterium]
MSVILMNRAAFERALANASGPMTDEQRRAMFARRSKGYAITADQARSNARRAQAAALGSKVVLTDVSPVVSDVGPYTPRSGVFTETVRQSPQSVRVTQGNMVPGQDIGSRNSSKSGAELVRERNRTTLPIPSAPSTPKQIISEQRKSELQELYLAGGMSKELGDALIASGVITPKTGGVVGAPRAGKKAAGRAGAPASRITADGRRIALPDRGLGRPDWYVSGGGGLAPGLSGSPKRSR